MKWMFKASLVVLVSTVLQSAEPILQVECGLSHESMVLIAKTERHPKRNLGYPYLISFNNLSEAKAIYPVYKDFFIPNKGIDRTIDCKNEEICVDILNDLIGRGITNLDLGGFQVNYKMHKDGFSDYYNNHHEPLSKQEFFRLAESYEYACAYAEKHVERWGPTFKALAMYHSKNPKHRDVYAKRMYDEYKKNN